MDPCETTKIVKMTKTVKSMLSILNKVFKYMVIVVHNQNNLFFNNKMKIPLILLTLCTIERTSSEKIDDMMFEDFVNSNVHPQARKWENGQVNYVVTGDFNEGETRVIAEALDEIEERTNGVITFNKVSEGSKERNRVEIIKADGCWSYVGRIGGKQDLSLGNGCVGHSTVQHEFLHALGFLHEHQRVDRDEHVRINWENVKDGFDSAFSKSTYDGTQGLPYDYLSVMHYGKKAFSKNKKPTIEPLDGDSSLGNWKRATDLDLKKLVKYYGGEEEDNDDPNCKEFTGKTPRFRPGVIDLGARTVTLKFPTDKRFVVYLGVYTGNHKNYHKRKHWWNKKRIMFKREGNKISVSGPGINFKTSNFNIPLAKVGDDLQVLDTTVPWGSSWVLDMVTRNKFEGVYPVLC